MSEPDYTSDPWLDARLRNVPLPLGLLARLQEIGNAETQQMDQVMRDVPVPADLLDRLRLIPEMPERRVGWRQLALAASLLLAVGLAALGWRNGLWSGGAEVARQQQQANDPLVAEHKTAHVPSDDMSSDDAGPLENTVADQRSSRDMANEELDLAVGRDKLTPEFDPWAARIETALRVAGNHSGNTAKSTPEPAPSLSKEERLAHEKALGARMDGRESLPDLESVEVRIPRGITPPRVAGYDLLYQLRYGQHPLVDPSHKELSSVQVPLVTSSASYRRAMRELAEGHLPTAADVRTEEFLAGLDYGFPPAPEGTVAVQTAAGPSPLSPDGLSLLQVAIKAGPLPHESHEATQLTVILDTSNSMQYSARWAAVQRALDHLRAPMGPADRITLIGYNDDAEVLVDNKGPEEVGRLASAMQTVAPRRAANLAAGLSLGCSLMPRSPEDGTKLVRRLVVISGGRVDSTDEASDRVRGRVAELAKAGVMLQVLDLGRDEQPSVALAPWSEAAEGRVTHVADPSSLYWNLLEALIGRSPVVAAHASLRVTFNKDAVAAYRLVGHERVTITGAAQATTEIDLRSGESVSGLFELQLKPTGADKVASIEVAWQKPGYIAAKPIKQNISRKQFAHSFTASPPALQAAAVAAATAETLRASYYAHATQSLARVVDLTRQVSPAVQQQPSFRELSDFVQRAERIRTRGGSR